MIPLPLDVPRPPPLRLVGADPLPNPSEAQRHAIAILRRAAERGSAVVFTAEQVPVVLGWAMAVGCHRDPVAEIVRRVAVRLDVGESELMDLGVRTARVATARHLAWWLVRRHLGLSFPLMAGLWTHTAARRGAAVVRPNHATVLLGVRRVERALAADQPLPGLPPGLAKIPVRQLLAELAPPA